jgi:phosphosulfolactate phosphohydrolase-like enzyme
MKDPIRHVVVDTNILGDFLYPNGTKAVKRVERSKILLSAVLNARWPAIKLYTPAICIAEAMGILDKYRFCSWGNDIKKDSSLKLSAADYRSARKVLTDAVGQRTIEQLEHEPTHVLMAGLISPVNSYFQIRRNKRKKLPMGAADCVIAGMAIHLVSRMGRESALLVTGDQRMADVVRKAGTVKEKTAESLSKVVSLYISAACQPQIDKYKEQ